MSYACGCTCPAEIFIFVEEFSRISGGQSAKCPTCPNGQARQSAFRPRCLFACLPVGMENSVQIDQFDTRPDRLANSLPA
jgi:hypothetical protein